MYPDDQGRGDPVTAAIAAARRRAWLGRAVGVELIACLWVVAEAAFGAWAAFQAGSLAITAFCVDSAIEWLAGAVLLARLAMEYSGRLGRWHARGERAASGVVGLLLFGLAGYVAWEAGVRAAAHHQVHATWAGWAVAIASALVTPWLGRQKLRLGRLLDSPALIGDAACSMTCAYMAWTLLASLAFEAWLPGLWWIDPLAALGIVHFALREAWASVAAAWTGQGHVHVHVHSHVRPHAHPRAPR
ncbi:hypothetical protein GCM10010885_18110 [Alicyclobacillus cellulosilyticus]|uniref:Cation efflux protein transmembrane domain-containing protein n=1 Tax=Alicyclobacillus cellulosilyticus TaxID=1003997 RepID=A0A917KEZ4_9BACL|nr:cation transporter [Alicyclobacillus cellulosilyticus]GGJ09387.1 hypothetical protein GCM10010885_18110 [Alicyclobacillus cellulosilyticus]